MKRLLTASGAVLAAALLILANRLGPSERPTFGSAFGGAAMPAPILTLAPELRP